MLLTSYHPGQAPREPTYPGKRAHWLLKLWFYWRDLTYNYRWRRWYFGRYLKSAAWKDKRTAIIKRDKMRCTRCGSSGGRTNPLQVHHTPQGYKSVGRESAASPYVFTLCRSCHGRQHGR